MVEKTQQPSDQSISEIIGYEFNDPIYSLLNGDLELSEKARENLTIELSHVVERLFPYQSGVDKKFKFTYESDKKLEKFFDDYLSGNRTRSVDRNVLYSSYAHSASLDSFFERIAYRLLKNAIAYIGVYWASVDELASGLTLPVKFNQLPISTIRVNKDREGTKSYKQVFNPLSAPEYFAPNLIGKTINLDTENLFILNYPFGEPPVQIARNLATERQMLLQQTTDRVILSTSVDTGFRKEMLRHTRYSDLHLKRQIIQAKIRKIFKLPVDTWIYPEGSSNDPDVTDYYRAYRLVEYLRYLQNFRDHIINEFNRQILGKIQQLNNLPTSPKLVYQGKHASIDEIDKEFKNFCSGEISFANLAERIYHN